MNLTLQLVRALQHLHGLEVCHRDLKVENVLMLGDVVKLGDFGSATTHHTLNYTNATKTQVYQWQDAIERECTNMYRAPELID
jgi:serine/threonine protein kinase